MFNFNTNNPIGVSGNSTSEILIPTPHVRFDSIFVQQGTELQDPTTLTGFFDSDTLKIKVKFIEEIQNNIWLNHKPMVFLNIWKATKVKSKWVRKKIYPFDPLNPTYSNVRIQMHSRYVHPSHEKVPLNRIATKYGGGTKVGGMISETNFTPTKPRIEQEIEIRPSSFFKRWVNFPLRKTDANNGQLEHRYNNGKVYVPSQGSTFPYYRTLCEIQFAIINPKNPKELLFSKPSKSFIIEPKSGKFNDGDIWYYGFQPNNLK